MRVAVDGRMLFSSGIGRYTRQLLGHVIRLVPDVRLTILGRPSEIRSFASEQGAPLSRLEIHPFDAPIYSIAEQTFGALAFQRVPADLLLFPQYNVPLLVRRRFVVCIHDVAHVRFPATFGRARSLAARTVLASALRRASRVVTVSRTTERDVTELFPDVAGKIVVARSGVTRTFRPADAISVAEMRRRFGLPTSYVVSVGNRKPLKNLGVAAAAVRNVRAAHPTLAWVVVGQRFSSPDDVDRSKPELGPALIELTNVPDEELRLIYAGAVALLMPSRWEGLGLPALEAMACGTPVVGADIPALREVVGTAGVLCGPDDVPGLGAMLQRLLDDRELRFDLSRRGQERSREFTWDSAAATAWRSFEEALA